MNKLILLCGISGSGKSAYSSKIIQENPNKYVRVSRDKIREMLYSYTEDSIKNYYNRKDIYILEKQVTFVENILIEEFLKTKSVVVDATHLKAKYLNKFNVFSPDEIEIVFFDISYEEARKRDNARVRKVGEVIITKQYENYLNLKKFLTSNKLKFDYICKEIK